MSEVIWSPGWREQQINKLRLQPEEKQWDLVIVGGGITGAGVLREATRRGLKVLLVEQKDFAWGTSSRSSKMVHGGLRYLGSGQIGLTLESVKERQRLLTEVPGLVKPLNFLMGHYKGGFPGPFIFNVLLTIYDFMAGKRNHRFIKTAVKDFFAPGMNSTNLKGATQFADAVTDDARLVLRVLHEANKEGGVALNYVSAQDTVRENGRVTGLKLKDEVSGVSFEVTAKAVVNASGAWTDELRSNLGVDAVIRPLRGSHLVVPSWRLPTAYSVSFFHPKDKRPVFAFPWEGVTVLGTTDLDHQQNMKKDASITQEEVDYLLEGVNLQFPEANITEKDVISSYSGVRPVVGTGALNPSSEKREHSIWDDQGLISVAGGKLTTFRLIALDVLKGVEKHIPSLDVNSGDACIFKETSAIDGELVKKSGLSSYHIKRLEGRYGAAAASIVQQTATYEAEGATCIAKTIATTDTLFSELRWALENETVVHLEDLLLRRTRLGLLLKNGGETLFDRLKPLCKAILGWDEATWNSELSDYKQLIVLHYGLPSSASPSSGLSCAGAQKASQAAVAL